MYWREAQDKVVGSQWAEEGTHMEEEATWATEEWLIDHIGE